MRIDATTSATTRPRRTQSPPSSRACLRLTPSISNWIFVESSHCIPKSYINACSAGYRETFYRVFYWYWLTLLCLRSPQQLRPAASLQSAAEIFSDRIPHINRGGDRRPYLSVKRINVTDRFSRLRRCRGSGPADHWQAGPQNVTRRSDLALRHNLRHRRIHPGRT